MVVAIALAVPRSKISKNNPSTMSDIAIAASELGVSFSNTIANMGVEIASRLASCPTLLADSLFIAWKYRNVPPPNSAPAPSNVSISISGGVKLTGFINMTRIPTLRYTAVVITAIDSLL